MFRPRPLGAAPALLIALAGITVVSGCNGRTGVKGKGARAVQEVAIGMAPPFNGDIQCVYYQALDSGDFYRVSLDGSIRERVLEGSKERGVELSVDKYAVDGNWRLIVKGIPRSRGTTTIDKTPVQTDRAPYYETTTSEPAYFVNSDKPCPWTITFRPRKVEIEPGHYHNVWDKVEYKKPGITATYDFQRESPELCGVWLIDNEHAVVLDSPNVLLWNLVSDEKTCIAHSMSAVVWPRNLREKERVNPYATVGGKSWTTASPDDVDFADH